MAFLTDFILQGHAFSGSVTLIENISKSYAIPSTHDLNNKYQHEERERERERERASPRPSRLTGRIHSEQVLSLIHI